MATRRMHKYAWQLVRDMYESLLMLATGLLLHINDWHFIGQLQEPHPQPPTWLSSCFCAGLLLALLRYRPQWIKRCSHSTRLLLLLLELGSVLYAVDLVQLQLWEPFLGIVDLLLHVLGHARRAAPLYKYWPGLSAWLINDSFYVVRCVCTLSLLLLALETIAANWLHALEYLLLGKVPKPPAVQRLFRRSRRQRKIDNSGKTLAQRAYDVCIKRFTG